uniref:Uncharacterized protein n=1 Tax=Opuntia streptacantha TaxID=393608 RepID=A0A7C8YVI7_OPUST
MCYQYLRGRAHLWTSRFRNSAYHSILLWASIMDTFSSFWMLLSEGNQCIRTPKCITAGINLNRIGVVTKLRAVVPSRRRYIFPSTRCRLEARLKSTKENSPI